MCWNRSEARRRRRLRARRFRDEEAGAGTVFSLMLLFLALLLGGLAVDVNNAWRYNELLKTTADVAAHAGAVVLAQGGSGEEARAAAEAALALNMPEAQFGRILVTPADDIRALRYDAETRRMAEDGEANALMVRVERGAANDNPVPTLLLKLFGRKGWNIADVSLAAVLPSQTCQPTDGVFARGALILGGAGHVGRDYCLHSQERVEPGLGTRFDPGAHLSMPDLARCGLDCAGAGDGIEAAATEMNLIRPDLAGFIRGIVGPFLDPLQRGGAEDAFFARRRLGPDLSALDEVGVPIDTLATGAIVALTPLAFERLRLAPEGLIYAVHCPGGAQAGLELSGGPSGQRIYRNLVLVTDCAVKIAADARIEGALILSTRAGMGFAVTAEPGARLGDPEGRCGAELRTTILATGSVMLPADTLGANVGVVSTDDIRIPAPPGAGARTWPATGLGLHAGGAISLDAAQDFQACEPTEDPFSPGLRVIRQMEPGAGMIPGSGPRGRHQADAAS
jgi:Flp pilus assembly protein TadG